VYYLYCVSTSLKTKFQKTTPLDSNSFPSILATSQTKRQQHNVFTPTLLHYSPAHSAHRPFVIFFLFQRKCFFKEKFFFPEKNSFSKEKERGERPFDRPFDRKPAMYRTTRQAFDTLRA